MSVDPTQFSSKETDVAPLVQVTGVRQVQGYDENDRPTDAYRVDFNVLGSTQTSLVFNKDGFSHETVAPALEQHASEIAKVLGMSAEPSTPVSTLPPDFGKSSS